MQRQIPGLSSYERKLILQQLSLRKTIGLPQSNQVTVAQSMSFRLSQTFFMPMIIM